MTEPTVIVTVNGWLLDVTPDEAHDAVCWPPHPRPFDPRRPEPPMDWRFALGVLVFVVLAFAGLITIEIGAWLGWWV